MLLVGLTGSIAMGKSTIANFFREENIDVFCADDIVKQLYEKNSIIKEIAKIVPLAIEDNKINRKKLTQHIIKDENILIKIENLLQPLIKEEKIKFIKKVKAKGARFAVFDIPLLFEKKYENQFNKIIVVDAPVEIQKKRALARVDMNEEKLNFILSKQINNKEKVKKADFVINSAISLDYSKQQVKKIIDLLNGVDVET
ncbi:dephospho-CoA kinase [Bartonella sp. DGB1]|uniref:dephospho-CoA kinase n=1 Tax=Bartonella sp. DGB1 TaxID=3239807 RepID=UPI0035236233